MRKVFLISFPYRAVHNKSSKVKPRSLQTGINADNEYFFEIITVESEPRLFERSFGNCLLY